MFWMTACGVRTVTVKLQLAVLAGVAVSVAVHVTLVVPIGKIEPEAGLQTTDSTPQLSLAVAAKVATAPVGQVGSLVMFAGQVIVGGVLSTTVTVA
jgi:hypothetical protein